jgi:hypothetical protein
MLRVFKKRLFQGIAVVVSVIAVYVCIYAVCSFSGGYWLQPTPDGEHRFSVDYGGVALATAILWQPFFGEESPSSEGVWSTFFAPLLYLDRRFMHPTKYITDEDHESWLDGLPPRHVHPKFRKEFTQARLEVTRTLNLEFGALISRPCKLFLSGKDAWGLQFPDGTSLVVRAGSFVNSIVSARGVVSESVEVLNGRSYVISMYSNGQFSLLDKESSLFAIVGVFSDQALFHAKQLASSYNSLTQPTQSTPDSVLPQSPEPNDKPKK